MTSSSGQHVETPSGKDTDYENFPVGSWLLPAALRPHIACYYRFARAIDDIADNPELSADVKIERLDGFEGAIRGQKISSPEYLTGQKMRESLIQTSVPEKHCLDLITAFKQDAVKNRYENWDELVDYCLLSAAPVGRYLIDLHGGTRIGYDPSDALCIALQVINHLQDCQEDFQLMDRVYIPQDLMRAEGIQVEVLNNSVTSDALRRVLDQVLTETGLLMPEARNLPSGLNSRRLAMESQAIIKIAEKLIDRLKSGDPLATRIKLPKMSYVWCCIMGVAGGLTVRAKP